MFGNSRTFTVTLMVLVLTMVSTGAALADVGGYLGTDYDLGGNTVTIGHWSPASDAARFEEGGLAEGVLEEAEALFNCEITFDGVDYGAIGEWYLTRLMAGDSKYDIWNVQNLIAYWPLASQDALFCIDPIVGDGYYGRLTNYEQFVLDTMRFKGKNFLFSTSVDNPEMERFHNGSYIMFYNKTMLENEGLESPFELYQAGEWDWAAMDAMFTQLTKDLDGDGEADQWGSAKITNWLAEAFVRANGAKFAEENEEGEIVYVLGGEPAEAALNQLNEWYAVDKVFHPAWSAVTDFASGSCGFMLYLWGTWDWESVLDQCDFEVGLVPIPRGPNVDKCIAPIHGVGGRALPSNVAQPEAMLALLEFLFRDDEEVAAEGFERNMSTFRDWTNAEMMLQLAEEWEGEVKTLYVGELGIAEIWQGNRQILDDVILGRKTFSESINSMKPVLQGYLDDTFNN